MDFSERDRIISLINEQEGFTPLITGFSEGGEVEDESPDEMSEDNEMEPEGFADGGEVTGGLFSEAADRAAALQAYAQPASQPATGPLAATIKPVSTQTLVQPTLPSAIQPTQAPAASAVTTPSAADILKTIPTFAAPSFTTPGAPAGGIPAVATTPTMAKPTLKAEKDLPPQVVNLAPLQVLESFGGTPISFARPESAKGYLTPEAAGAVGGVSFSGAPGAAGTAAGATTRTPMGYEYSAYRSLTPEQLAGSGNKAQITDMFKGIVTQQEKDVAALRNEYNQAMSYGNMDLANQLKPILQAQEAEVKAAKADQTMAAKYFTGVGGAYETPQMLQERVLAEQFKALKIPGYSEVDLGAIGFTPETKVDPFTAALNQQKNEYTAAQNVYNRLSSAYGKDSQYAKDYLEQYVNPQKAEYDRMLAAQKVATGAYGAITAGAAYKGFTAPKLADIRNVVQTENTYKPIITGFETNINNLTKARDQADAMGLSGYSQRLNQLIETENAKLEQARGERQSAIDKAQPDPMRDYILGKQLTAQKIEGFTGVDIGNVDFGKMQASAFDPIILRQQQDVNAAQNTYNQLVNLYGANNDTTKAFLNDVLNPQKQELAQANAFKKAAGAAIGAYNTGKGYSYVNPPAIAVNKSTKDEVINKAYDDFIRNTYEKRISLLDAAKAKAEQAGLGQYGDYFNQLMDTQRSFIDRANEARNATFAKRDAATRAKGSPQEGEIADPVAKLVAQGSRTKDDGMDSTARAMLKKFAGGGEAKASAAPGEITPLEATETPIVGSVGRGIQRAAEFASAPFGYENPPVRMLMDLLSIPGAGRAIEDVAQGLPLTRGKGQARQLSGNAKALLEAAVNVAPGAGPATKAVAKGAKKAAKELGPIAAEQAMKYAPAAEPMYAVKPKGGTFYPEGYGSRMDEYLENVVKDLSTSETLAGKDAKAVADFIRTKGRKYLTTAYGTADDPLRAALLEGRLPRYGSDKERFRNYLMNAAREGDPEAMQDLERAYDTATGVRALSYVPPEMETTSYAVSGKVDRAVREKMAAEGVDPDLMNPEYPAPADKKSLTSSYSSQARKELARLMQAAESMPIDEARQSFLAELMGGEKALLYAAEKGEPIYDVIGPSSDFLYPRNVAQGIASIPVDDLQRMSFPEAVVKGAQNMRLKRDWESVIENAKAGKAVPKEIFFQGTSPVYEIDKNQKWVRIMTPDAVELEGAAMRHSIGGYKTSNSYNLGGRPAFESGWARVFSLRNEKGVPQVTVESKFTDDGGLEITQIKSKFNSMPTPEEKKAVFELFDTLGPNKFKSDTYSSTRTGDRLDEAKTIDWGNEYQDYLKYKNKGEE